VLPARSVTTFSSDLSNLGAPTPGDDEERPDYVPPRSSETGCACRVTPKREPGGAGLLALLVLSAAPGLCRRARTTRSRSDV